MTSRRLMGSPSSDQDFGPGRPLRRTGYPRSRAVGRAQRRVRLGNPPPHRHHSPTGSAHQSDLSKPERCVGLRSVPLCRDAEVSARIRPPTVICVAQERPQGSDRFDTSACARLSYTAKWPQGFVAWSVRRRSTDARTAPWHSWSTVAGRQEAQGMGRRDTLFRRGGLEPCAIASTEPDRHPGR
jgi:hypothetical protein